MLLVCFGFFGCVTVRVSENLSPFDAKSIAWIFDYWCHEAMLAVKKHKLKLFSFYWSVNYSSVAYCNWLLQYFSSFQTNFNLSS